MILLIDTMKDEKGKQIKEELLSRGKQEGKTQLS